MKKHILLSLIILLNMNTAMYAQSSIADATKTVGANPGSPTADYATLKEAFDAINAGTLTGNITLQIIRSTTESASAVLNAGSYTSVSIYPTTTGLSIIGNINYDPLISLYGADNVTIDGRVNATGNTVSLVISNTSTTDMYRTSTIGFNNDATYNTVKYCKIQGSNKVGDHGVLSFNNTATSTGNSHNTIDHNEITNAGGNRPRNALFSCGKDVAPNSSNTVSNNNFYDLLNLDQNYTKGN